MMMIKVNDTDSGLAVQSKLGYPQTKFQPQPTVPFPTDEIFSFNLKSQIGKPEPDNKTSSKFVEPINTQVKTALKKDLYNHLEKEPTRFVKAILL